MTNRTVAPIYRLDTMPPHIEAAIGYLARFTNQNTHKLYTRYLNDWFAWCEHQEKNPLDITRAYIELYVHEISQGHKASSVGSAMTPIRGYYEMAHIDGKITTNPAAYVRLPKIQYKKRPPVETYDLKHFLRTARDTSPRHWAASQMLCSMGMRASEACSITVEQALEIDRGMRVLRYIGKGGKPTEKAIPAQSVASIDAAINGRTTGWLLTNLRGDKLTRNALYGLMRTVGNRAGIRMNPHYLRSAAATMMLDAGASLFEAQRFLDHSDIRTTQKHYDLRQHDVATHPAHFVGAKLAI